jgi:hypothetical protein
MLTIRQCSVDALKYGRCSETTVDDNAHKRSLETVVLQAAIGMTDRYRALINALEVIDAPGL